MNFNKIFFRPKLFKFFSIQANFFFCTKKWTKKINFNLDDTYKSADNCQFIKFLLKINYSNKNALKNSTNNFFKSSHEIFLLNLLRNNLIAKKFLMSVNFSVINQVKFLILIK